MSENVLKSGFVLNEGENLIMELEAELWSLSSNPIARLMGAITRIIAMICGTKRSGFIIVTDQRVIEISTTIICYCFVARRSVRFLSPESIKEVGYMRQATFGCFCPMYLFYFQTFTGTSILNRILSMTAILIKGVRGEEDVRNVMNTMYHYIENANACECDEDEAEVSYAAPAYVAQTPAAAPAPAPKKAPVNVKKILTIGGIAFGGIIVLSLLASLISAIFSGNPIDEFFREDIEYATIEDSRDNQEYRTITIGNQTWIAQNMNYETRNSYCDSCELYGRLYNFDEAQSVCPEGFVLPTLKDINLLIQNNPAQLMSRKVGGSDDVGFASILNGFYSFKDHSVKRRNEIAGYWIALAQDTLAVRLKIDNKYGTNTTEALSKSYGFSVRCIAASSSDNSEANVMIDTRDGKIYKTVQIGSQTWMAENLNYKAKDSKCASDDDEDCKTYGRVYSTGGSRYCPAGWHLPSINEWEKLFKQFGSRKKKECEELDYDTWCWNTWPNAGELKGTEFEGSNKFGMNLQLAGSGFGYDFGSQGNFWASKTKDGVVCFNRNGNTASEYCAQDMIMTSIRCVK